MVLALLRKVGSWYEYLEEVLLVCLLFGMVALGAAQIFFRNVISIGLVWIDPLLRHLVLWVALLGASIATRENRHISIEILPARLSAATRTRIYGGLQIFSALVCLVLVYPAVTFVLDDYRVEKYLVFQIPRWVAQTVMPVMLLVLGIRFMLQGVKSLVSGRRG
jgi:TRAP-type C4-dicarboxylate transport system permease small subunit